MSELRVGKRLAAKKRSFFPSPNSETFCLVCACLSRAVLELGWEISQVLFMGRNVPITLMGHTVFSRHWNDFSLEIYCVKNRVTFHRLLHQFLFYILQEKKNRQNNLKYDAKDLSLEN